MIIREYTESDLDALRRMHASQGFDYPFPDLADPIFVSKLVLEDDSGRPVMAALARLTCEMYLLVDRENENTVGAQHAGPYRTVGVESALKQHGSATNGCWRCTLPANATSTSAVSMTRTRGFRRQSRKGSDAASKPSAGSATTHGRRIAAG